MLSEVMQKYRIHEDLPTVTRIAYGCMGLGGDWAGGAIPEAVRTSDFAAIEAALEAGINFFDHADIYKRGNAERVFGEFLAGNPGLRERIVLQSKCGICDGFYDFDKDYILASVEGSLERLGVEQLDLLLLHRPDLLVEPDEVAAAFDQLHAAGKVKAFGVSNHTAAQIELLQRSVNQKLCINQIRLSLNHHMLISDGIVNNTDQVQWGDPLLDYCRLKDIRIQAYSCVGKGRLLIERDDFSEAEQAARVLMQSLGEKYGVGMDAILVAWLLRHPAGFQPILGTAKAARIAPACAADGVELTRPEWYALLEKIRGHRAP
jgi:predicted oxidoreductase